MKSNSDRKQIGKKLRFEVFKRDSFRCQYCGRSAPDVILEVDHISPVAEGGTNDIMNLVTACRDCNRGKGAKTLSDDTVVKVAKKQLDELNEKREQMEMMLQWQKELRRMMDEEVEAIDDIFASCTDYILSDLGKQDIRTLIRRFSYREVYEATCIAIDRYYTGSRISWQEAFGKIGGICYNRRNRRPGVENAE